MTTPRGEGGERERLGGKERDRERDRPRLTCIEDLLGLVESRHGWAGHGHGVLTLARLHRVVILTVIVGVEELLEPLDKLKVVLELPLYQLVHWDDLGVNCNRTVDESIVKRP